MEIDQSVVFYCVGCNQLKMLEQARLVFRTGYYRLHYPLGCCVNCECQSK